MEFVYNVIETVLIVGFIVSYFEIKLKYNKKITVAILFLLILGEIIIMTILDPPWIITLCVSILYLVIVMRIFFKEKLLEHLLISVITYLLLAVIDISVLTLMSKILGVEYNELVTKSNISRFLALLIAKLVYLICLSIIVSFKRKYVLILHNIGIFMISSALTVSCILISIIRNIIYNAEEYYNTFLVIILCLLLLNIVQNYMMIYIIGQKNTKEKNISLMQKQIEMQEDSIRNLELKYDETAKIRHDMKNYISCALNLAEQKDNAALIEYLKEISEYKINPLSSYVKTKRRILGAVINSKLSIAEIKGIDMQCMILNEMDSIKDIDLGILIGNLLDNAIEACDKNSGHSKIILKMWNDAGYYCMEVCNTIETDVLSENPNLFTSKRNKDLHGIGLRSVKDIVKKYNGMINFKQKSNTFHVYISLERFDL
jgi:signal transduction histidine kinase regulating citrate/malate metabolism